MYFYFKPLCIINWQFLILFLSSFWNFLLRCHMVIVKLLLSMKFLIFSRHVFDNYKSIAITSFGNHSTISIKFLFHFILFMIFSLCQEMYFKCCFFKDRFIALRCSNVYMNFFIKTVPDTSLHETSDLT